MNHLLSSAQMYPLFRGLALLLHAGVPLADGALFLAADAPARQAELCRALGRHLDDGESLSEAMAATGAFPAHVTGLVRVGERSGRLEQALETLAAEHERQASQTARLRAALSYPALLLLLVLGVLGVLLVEVLPLFDRVYASFGGGLTGLAGWLLGLGQAIKAALPWLGGLLGLFGLAVLLFACSDTVRGTVVGCWQRHFGHKGTAKALGEARFAAALAMALQSGLPEEEALSLAGELLTETPQAHALCRRCRECYEESHDLPAALLKSAALPAAECRLLALGLRSGRGDEVSAEIARRLDERAQLALERAVGRVEPAMVLAAAVLVGAILMSVMLPLLDLLTALG